MVRMRFWATGLIAAAVAGAAFAGPLGHCMRPPTRPGVPDRDYQYRTRSPASSAISGTMLRMDQPAKAHRGLAGKQIRLYQLDRPGLQIDHCAISRVALQLHDDGIWVLSLRADQNRQDEPAAAPPPGEQRKATAHIKRNQFVVKLRCYGRYEVKEAEPEASTGKPVLVQIEPERFWVQRGEPRHFVGSGKQEDLTRYFDLIDRVEIEFFYY